MKLSGQVKQGTGLRQWGPVLSSTKKKAELPGTLTRQAAETKLTQKGDFGSLENHLTVLVDTGVGRLASSRALPDKTAINFGYQRNSVERSAIQTSSRQGALRERINRLHKDEGRGHSSLNPKESPSVMQSQNFQPTGIPLKKTAVPLSRGSGTKPAIPTRFHRENEVLGVEVRERPSPAKNSPDPKVSKKLTPKPLDMVSDFGGLEATGKPITPRRLFEEPANTIDGLDDKPRRSRQASRTSLVKPQSGSEDSLSAGQTRTCPLSLNAARIIRGATAPPATEQQEDWDQTRISDDSDCTLTAEEEKTYGKRFMPGYDKLKLLGKGGQALVWLGRNLKTGELSAIKQIVIGGFVNEKSARKEIELSDLIFSQADGEFLVKLGKQSLVNIRDHLCTKTDLFMAMDIGGSSLSRWIYSMKGVFLKSERIYKITHNKLYLDMRRNPLLFKKLATQLLVGLHVLQERGIVHCDMKPENILVKYNPQDQNTEDVKIIDFGASFMFDGQPFLTVTTPEYLPPEFLQLFSQKKAMNNKQKHDWLRKHCQPWSIDVWGLGVILIECLIGVPVWMSFKCQTHIEGREMIRLGLFSSPARDNDKIADKMVKFVPGMRKKLRDMVGEIPHIDLITDLLEKMLQLDPSARPSPAKLLSHPLFETN